MERRQIRELIGRFLHNDVPGELQTQFRRWMLQPGDGDEKEAALREEWTAVVESPAAADRSEEHELRPDSTFYIQSFKSHKALH